MTNVLLLHLQKNKARALNSQAYQIHSALFPKDAITSNPDRPTRRSKTQGVFFSFSLFIYQGVEKSRDV